MKVKIKKRKHTTPSTGFKANVNQGIAIPDPNKERNENLAAIQSMGDMVQANEEMGIVWGGDPNNVWGSDPSNVWGI